MSIIIIIIIIITCGTLTLATYYFNFIARQLHAQNNRKYKKTQYWQIGKPCLIRTALKMWACNYNIIMSPTGGATIAAGEGEGHAPPLFQMLVLLLYNIDPHLPMH